MRILVYPAMMEIGGSQLNAIELAAQMTREGHEVVMYAPSGELNEVAAAQGVEVVRSPCEQRWPTRASLTGLLRLVRERKIEIVHAYEWGPSVEAALGPYGLLGVPMITTVLSMDVPDLIPLQPPLIVGTAELAAAQSGVRTVHLAEPWIDTEANAPGITDRAVARSGFGLAASDTVLTVVCRLTSALEKADGVLAAMRAVRRRNTEQDQRRFRLLVVGDGERLAEIRKVATDHNAIAGFEEIVVLGPLLDPRAAYDCADVIIGMGSSALKGLSFGRPLIVQGTGGYWRAFTPETVQIFDHQGFFGHDTLATADAAATALLAQLDAVLGLGAEAQSELGAYGRRYIESRFSLRAASITHLGHYATAVASPPRATSRLATLRRTAVEAAKLNLALWRHHRRASGPAATIVAEPDRIASQNPPTGAHT